jgi:two-component system nitrate/nitrite sensor histidine kinase NarX
MAPLLTEYVAQFSRQTGIQAQLTIEPPGLLVTPATALQLMRIAQEALANVRRHAQASQAEVSLRNIENKLELTITDNGLGFPDALPEDLGQHHFGLATMRERARSLGGALTIATGVHQGTRITVAVPNSKVQKNGVNSP